jgi:GT2 family glycosyltransferase
MMVPRKAFDDIGGFDERLDAAYNDIDICLRLRKRGYLIVYTPLAVLCYSEFAVHDRLGTAQEEKLFRQRWNGIIQSGDPYYNPSLTITREDWSLKIDP